GSTRSRRSPTRCTRSSRSRSTRRRRSCHGWSKRGCSAASAGAGSSTTPSNNEREQARMSDPLVLVESRPDGVTLLRLNRPPLNPLSTALLRELEGIAGDLTADASVKAVVVTGGDKAFAAGADVSEFTADGAAPVISAGIRAGLDALAAIPRPVIAAINGFA